MGRERKRCKEQQRKRFAVHLLGEKREKKEEVKDHTKEEKSY